MTKTATTGLQENIRSVRKPKRTVDFRPSSQETDQQRLKQPPVQTATEKQMVGLQLMGKNRC